MVEIEIFLSFHEAQISFLSIPRSDIERLAVFPFRWIRYVMFTICGARGTLSTTPRGPPVDYDKTEFADAENTYYYQPLEDCAFVDHEGLNDRLTCTAQTPRHQDFRYNVMQRDGDVCVVTQTGRVGCDAVHLIPRSKGEKYIAKVIQLRSPRDNSALPSSIGIDDMVNGMFLSKTLHSQLGIGEIAFIRTPNYGLRPEDIRRFQRGGSRPDYITLHWLKRPENYDPTSLAALQALQNGGVDPSPALLVGAAYTGTNVDALFQGEKGSLPSTVILDYVYGVAAYKSWHANVVTFSA
ncbi:hypothetical protein BC827DRAFT_668182 [Russula dissimulans]|nr:hypothetical protein BC827DRAFT_668182 [Russula dissimulans]